MKQVYLPDASLRDLFAIARFESAPSKPRRGRELWLSLPHGHDLPLHTVVQASERLEHFIRANSIYGNEPNLDRSHYLEIVFRDDGSALVTMQYQQIIGSRWLCIVPQSAVLEFIRQAQQAAA